MSKKLFAPTAFEVPWLTWKFGANVAPRRRGTHSHLGYHFVQQLAERDRGPVQWQHAGLETGQVKQFGDQPAQAVEGLLMFRDGPQANW